MMITTVASGLRCYFIATPPSSSGYYSWYAAQHGRRRRNFHKSLFGTAPRPWSSIAIRGAASVDEGAGEASARKNTKNIAAASASSHGSSFKSTRREKDNGGNGRNSDNTNDRYEKFVNDIISFLNDDIISYECLSDVQLRNVLEVERRSNRQPRHYYPKPEQTHYYSIDEIMELVKYDVFLIIIGNSNSNTRFSKYVLHLCSIPHLTTMTTSYQRYHHHTISNDSSGSSTSDGSSSDGSSSGSGTSGQAVAAHAWLNSHLTNAFSSSSLSSFLSNEMTHRNDDDGQRQHGSNNNNSSNNNDIVNNDNYQLLSLPSSIVHLHYDVWIRCTNIVKSRLRTKCGLYNNGRYYARKTFVRRICNKMEGSSFLIDNHLWGVTNYKHAYGLYINTPPPPPQQELTLNSIVSKKYNYDDTADQQTRQQQTQQLVAMVTFSSGRKVLRSNKTYISYELLRYCTLRDTTIVGGLTKLISAFVKDINISTEKDANMKDYEGMDIVTSIDRDFGGCGSATWPNFNTVHIMDPIPMFVGNGDGIRRHVIGCGLLPLDQQQQQHQTMSTNNDNSNAKSDNNLLRAGLPDWLLHRLEERNKNANEDNDSAIALDDDTNNMTTTTTMKKDTTVYDPWQDVAQYGYHPVFDAGVERLMMLVEMNKVAYNGDNNISTMTPMELWGASTPCYAREHYSSNAGVSAMLDCIRSVRN